MHAFSRASIVAELALPKPHLSAAGDRPGVDKQEKAHFAKAGSTMTPRRMLLLSRALHAKGSRAPHPAGPDS